MRDDKTLVSELARELDLPHDEAELYIRALRDGGVTTVDLKSKRLAESLVARGVLIKKGSGSGYVPVHPRLALSNLFRTFEEKLTRQRKEKRLLVDKLTLELLPLHRETKDTNLRGA